jgi:hypothetical protein
MIHLDNEHIHRIHPIEPVGPEFIFMHFSGNLSASPRGNFIELMLQPLHGLL